MKTFKHLREASFAPNQIKMAIGVASDKRYAGGNYSGAVKAIEKIKRGLSKHPQVAAVLKRQNEMTEGKMSQIDAMRKAGKSAQQIAKAMNIPVKIIKDLLGEEIRRRGGKVARGYSSSLPQGKNKQKEVDFNPKVTTLPGGKRLVTRKLGKGSIMLDPFGRKYK